MNRIKHTCRNCIHGHFVPTAEQAFKFQCQHPSLHGRFTTPSPKYSCPDWEVKPELKERVEK